MLLEIQAQAKLENSGGAPDTQNLPERWRTDRGVRIARFRPIEDVGSVRSELQGGPLRQSRVLNHGDCLVRV